MIAVLIAHILTVLLPIHGALYLGTRRERQRIRNMLRIARRRRMR